VSYHVYFEDVEVGSELPTFSRETDLMNWNRFAAVNDEFTYNHMDDDYGREVMGRSGAIGMGNLRLSYVICLLQDWAGDEADIREAEISFREFNHKGDVLTAVGTIVEKLVEDGEHLVRVETDVVNQDGVGTSPGHALVALPSRADGGAAS
jgi:acyl dehydratase